MGGHTVERLQAEGLAIGPAGAAAGTQAATTAKAAPANPGVKNGAATVAKK
jgi:competence protein ComEA